MPSREIPFLFIHGAGGTKSKWRLLRHHFAAGEAIYLDLPHHGTNSEPAQTSVEDFAAAISAEVKQDVIVVGHSLGGLIGIELAAMSRCVKGLVLAASHYRLPVNSGILAQLSEGIFPDSLFYASYSKKAASGLLEEERQELSLVPPQITASDYEACHRYAGGEHRIRQLKVPIRALYGEVDRLLPRTAMEELKVASSQVTSTVIRDSGHYVMLEQPEEVARSLTDFRWNVENQMTTVE